MRNTVLKYRCVQTAIHWDHGLCTGAQNGTGGYGGNASWRNAQLAIDQLNKEQEKHLKDANYCRIHEFLIDMVTANPELAEKITAKKDVLQFSLGVIRSEAQKNGVGIPDNVAFEKVLKELKIEGYEVVMKPEVRKVGTPEEPAAKRKKTYLDLDDFL